MPKPSEIEEAGFGFFRDVWSIIRVGTSAAADVIASEKVVASDVDAHARTNEDIEEPAGAFEWFGVLSTDDEIAAVDPGMDNCFNGLQGLDFGVTGLTYALSNCGF